MNAFYYLKESKMKFLTEINFRNVYNKKRNNFEMKPIALIFLQLISRLKILDVGLDEATVVES